ncbi:hypothetical protein D3C77_688700 [compost metagenome]
MPMFLQQIGQRCDGGPVPTHQFTAAGDCLAFGFRSVGFRHQRQQIVGYPPVSVAAVPQYPLQTCATVNGFSYGTAVGV